MSSLKRVMRIAVQSLTARRLVLAVAFMSATLSVGSAAQNICFPPHEGLPHTYLPPTIDGYIEPLPSIVAADAPETGWTRATRLTFGGDTVLPLAVMQTIKHNAQNLIYFSFDLHNDNNFDTQDVIVMVVDQAASGSSYSTNARRIHIYPVTDGVGAGTGPADETLGTTLIRKNRAPRNTEFYKWNTATSSWDAMTAPSNFSVKVRSVDYSATTKHWSVEVQMPTTNSTSGVGGGSNWINLGSPFAFYANLIRTCGSATTCPTVLGDYYTTQFTWPRSDAATSRMMVDPPSGSVPLEQVSVPRSWLGQGILSAPGTDCRGVRFVSGASSIGIRDPANPTGSLSNAISGTGNNTFVARVTNDGTGSANDVRAEFRIANWGIAADSTQNWVLVPHTGGDNPTAKQTIGSGGSTEFSFDWQLNSTEKGQYAPPNHHQCIWVKLNSTSDVDFVESSVRRNMNFIGLSRQVLPAVISAKGFPPPKSGNTHDIILETALVTLPNYSEKYRQAPAADVLREQGGARLMMSDGQRQVIQGLSQVDRLAWSRQIEAKKPLSQWVWVTYGHRDTGQVLTLGGKRFRVLDHVGSFGYFAEHAGRATGGFSAAIANARVQADRAGAPGVTPAEPGLTRGVGGTFSMKVPHNGAVSIDTALEAREECNCSCLDVKCKMECDKQANAGPTAIAGSLVLFGTIGVGGLAYFRRRQRPERHDKQGG